jgi:hypothetical protein
VLLPQPATQWVWNHRDHRSGRRSPPSEHGGGSPDGDGSGNGGNGGGNGDDGPPPSPPGRQNPGPPGRNPGGPGGHPGGPGGHPGGPGGHPGGPPGGGNHGYPGLPYFDGADGADVLTMADPWARKLWNMLDYGPYTGTLINLAQCPRFSKN